MTVTQSEAAAQRGTPATEHVVQEIKQLVESVLRRVRVAHMGPVERTERLLAVTRARRELDRALRVAEPDDPPVPVTAAVINTEEVVSQPDE